MNKYELIYDLKEHLEMCPNEEYYLSYNQVEMVVNYFEELQQENQQLKEQIKELKQSKLVMIDYEDIQQQLKQKDEVIDDIKKFLEDSGITSTMCKNCYIYDINGIEIYKILQKRKGDNNE